MSVDGTPVADGTTAAGGTPCAGTTAVGGTPQAGSERFRTRERNPLRLETLIEALPDLGLSVFDGPADPAPGIEIRDGRVVAIDGVPEADFDVIDEFIARHGIDVAAAAEAAMLDDAAIARRLVDVDVPRADLVRLSRGLTPARLARIVGRLDAVELMFAL